MNPASQKEALELFDAIKAGVKDAKAEVVICPPFIYVSSLKFPAPRGARLAQFHGRQYSRLKLGAQNVFWENKGAFTGEISPAMLKSSNVKYVIVGHSERRKYFGETNEDVAKKLQAVLEVGMTPILCVGENEGENREEVLREQLAGVSGFRLQASGLIVAYEPVWAIGTGKNCRPEDVKKAMETIKNLVGDVRVLYGGSVKADNAQEYLEVVDGLLVGGASLNAEEFIKIVEKGS